MQANLVITSQTTAGKKITTTISYINPDALNSKLKALAIALNNLTRNEFISAARATKNDDVDNPDPTPDTKTEPTLTVKTDGSGLVSYNGDGTLSAQFEDETLFANVRTITGVTGYNYQIHWNTGNASYDPDIHWTGTLYASEGTNYAAKSVEFAVWI